MKPARAPFLETADEPGAHLLLAGWTREEAHGEGAEVEAGASGDDGQMAARRDLAQGVAGLAGVFACIHQLIGVGYVDQVVRDLALLIGGWFGGAYVHAAVDGY